jgi:hypothetical protein
MKTIVLSLVLATCVAPTIMLSQTIDIEGSRRKPESYQPVLLRPLVRAQGLAKSSMSTSGSFYKSKARWQRIIDSTWGPGLPLAGKLKIFDAYATALNNKFDGFLSLGLNWDSLRSHYRTMIDSSTSRGRFAGIMSRFAISLRDAHTWALDTVVTLTPLSPGIPLLVLNAFAGADYFGAVLTTLPDSSALVLRTVPSHPLGLQPGDVILGYEGVRWKRLLPELLDAGLPIYSAGIGASSAQTHAWMRSVGNNWHLFDTIDVVKHATKDTLHLSLKPLLTLPSGQMMANEQLDVPGIPSAYFFPFQGKMDGYGQQLSYGMLQGTRIGYIQIVAEWPTLNPDSSFLYAIRALWNTDGLIIDMRWNIGGWATFDTAFSMMFQGDLTTLEDAYRSSPASFVLTAAGNYRLYQIHGRYGTFYDHKIAVLLGPTCVSMGDLTAQRLRYHPRARFFGKPPMASLGDNRFLDGYQDWWLRYSICDMFHMNQPGYLNRKEFPIDEPVWFNADDVARGVDPVLDRAVRWITTVSPVQVSQQVPKSFELLQNYPNPFNPSTTISYSLPKSATVTIKIFNALGQEVALLVNERKEAGNYQTTWNASNAPSGVYFYRLQAGEASTGSARGFVQTRKLLIVK